MGRARENDNFLALLLNKSVSIATIQPAAGEKEVDGERERGERGGAPERDRGKDRKREGYHSNGGRGRKRTWRRNFEKNMSGEKGRRRVRRRRIHSR